VEAFPLATWKTLHCVQAAPGAQGVLPRRGRVLRARRQCCPGTASRDSSYSVTAIGQLSCSNEELNRSPQLGFRFGWVQTVQETIANEKTCEMLNTKNVCLSHI